MARHRLADGPFLTSETVWDLTRAAASLLVLGGGPIGCELAAAFGRFRLRVTVVGAAARLLGKKELAASEVIAQVFKRDRIELLHGAKAVCVRYPPRRPSASSWTAVRYSMRIICWSRSALPR